MATAVGPAPINEGSISTAEDLVFAAPDGSHGNSPLAVYGATPEMFKLLGSWAPPHLHTTSYHGKCLVYAIVERRLFMRGFDGIHCYDLRRRSEPSASGGVRWPNEGAKRPQGLFPPFKK